jgi:hypothetical protein
MFLIFFPNPQQGRILTIYHAGESPLGDGWIPMIWGWWCCQLCNANFFCRVPRFKVALVMNQSNYQRFKPNRTGTVVAKR